MTEAKMPRRWNFSMVDTKNGDYVLYQDVESLVAEINRLRAENSHLRRIGVDGIPAELLALQAAALADLRAENECFREENARLRVSINVMARALPRPEKLY